MRTGEFTDAAVPDTLAAIMINRRDAILRAYLPAINPIITPRLDGARLSFENAAVAYNVANAPEGYRAVWFRFDNATGERRLIGETTGTTTSIQPPADLPRDTADLPRDTGSFVAVDLAADSAEHPSWKRPISVYFRHVADRWNLVGLERMSDGTQPPGRIADERMAEARQR